MAIEVFATHWLDVLNNKFIISRHVCRWDTWIELFLRKTLVKRGIKRKMFSHWVEKVGKSTIEFVSISFSFYKSQWLNHKYEIGSKIRNVVSSAKKIKASNIQRPQITVGKEPRKRDLLVEPN